MCIHIHAPTLWVFNILIKGRIRQSTTVKDNTHKTALYTAVHLPANVPLPLPFLRDGITVPFFNHNRQEMTLLW